MNLEINSNYPDFVEKTIVKKNGFKQSFFDIFNKKAYNKDCKVDDFIKINLMGFRTFINNNNIDDLSNEDFPDLQEGLLSMVKRMNLLIQMINDKQKNDSHIIENKELFEPLKNHNTLLHEFNGESVKSMEKYHEFSSTGSDLIKKINDKVESVESNITKKQIDLNNKCLETIYWLSKEYKTYFLNESLLEKTLNKHNNYVLEQNSRLNEFKEFRDVAEERFNIATNDMKKKFPENFSSEEEKQICLIEEKKDDVGKTPISLKSKKKRSLKDIFLRKINI